MPQITLNIDNTLNKELLKSAAYMQIMRGEAVTVTQFIREAITSYINENQLSGVAHTPLTTPENEGKQSTSKRVKITDSMRDSIISRDKQGDKTKDISQDFDLKLNTVQTLIRRAKKDGTY